MLVQLFNYINVLIFVFYLTGKQYAYQLLTARSFHQNVDNHSNFVGFFSKNFPGSSISGDLSCMSAMLLECECACGSLEILPKCGSLWYFMTFPQILDLYETKVNNTKH